MSVNKDYSVLYSVIFRCFALGWSSFAGHVCDSSIFLFHIFVILGEKTPVLIINLVMSTTVFLMFPEMICVWFRLVLP